MLTVNCTNCLHENVCRFSKEFMSYKEQIERSRVHHPDAVCPEGESPKGTLIKDIDIIQIDIKCKYARPS